MGRKIENQMLLISLLGPLHCKSSGYRVLSGQIEAEIWHFLVAHQSYLPLGVGSPVQKQVASGDRAIVMCNTVEDEM